MHDFLGEKSFFIPQLTSEQSGMYTCIVENSVGKVNQSIYLNVQCKFREKLHFIPYINLQMHHAFVLLNLVYLSIVLILQSYNVLSMQIQQLIRSNGLKIIQKSFAIVHQQIYNSIESNEMILVFTLVLLTIVFKIIKLIMVQVRLNFSYKVDPLSKQHIRNLLQKSVNPSR